MKPIFILLGALLILGGCASKRVTINGLICPAGHDDDMIKTDLRECRYYDMEAIEKASRPASELDRECLECLRKRGYEIE